MAKTFIECAKQNGITLPEEVGKYNPYHDARGRFATANGAASFSFPKDPKQRAAAIERERQRTAGGGGGSSGADSTASEETPKEPAVYEGDAAYQKVEEMYDSITKQHVTYLEEYAARLYAGDSKVINDYLRWNSFDHAEENGFGRNQPVDATKYLDNLISKTEVPEDMMVYRGSTLSAIGLNKWSRVKEKYQKELIGGKIITDRGFFSASLDQKVGRKYAFKSKGHKYEGVLLSIKVPKGTHATAITGMTKKGGFKNEAELLFARGTSIKVSKIFEAKEGIWHVHAEVVNNG